MLSDQDRIVVTHGTSPAPIGPYSAAIKANGMVFVSGQLGLDPATGELTSPDAAGQAKKILQHLESILDMADSGMGRVVKTTIYLTDMADFPAVNKVYAAVFSFDPPARATVQVAALPKGAKVEIDAIAMCIPAGAPGPSLM